MEHTPWELEDPNATITPYIISREGDVPMLIAKTYSLTYAEKIVQAVNAHEALVEALREAERAISGIERWCGNGMITGHRAKVMNYIGDRGEKARAALQKAGVTP